MNKIEKFNSSSELYNATSYFYEYLTGIRKTIDKSIVKKVELSLLSTYLLSLKEEVIIKKENLSCESNLYSNSFELLFKKIYDKIPPIIINGEIADEAMVFSFIRNKFAHGDFIYLENSDEISFNCHGTTFKLKTDDLLYFYFNMQNEIIELKNEKVYTRNLLINKSVKKLTKKLETEKEVEDFLKLFTLRHYSLGSMNNEIVPVVIKKTFTLAINQIHQAMNRNEDTKNLEEKIRKIYENEGYFMMIENKKIKDKEIIEKIKKAILSNERLKELDEPLESLTYSYGEIVKGILMGENKQSLIMGAITNLLLLEDNIKKDPFLFGHKVNDGFNELIAGLLIARFNSLYCQQLDDVYKKDNNYHLDRSDMLDFSLLNLDEFHPNIINVDEKGIKIVQEQISSITKKIKNLDNRIIQSKTTKDALEQLKPLDGKKQKVYDLTCNILENSQNTRNRLCNALYEKYLELEQVKKDYKENKNYFRNLAIIEGIRNSIAHGNIELLNATEVDNFNDLKIRFTNTYKDEIVFQLTTTLYNFQSLFEPYNIEIIDNFGKEKQLFKNI